MKPFDLRVMGHQCAFPVPNVKHRIADWSQGKVDRMITTRNLRWQVSGKRDRPLRAFVRD